MEVLGEVDVKLYMHCGRVDSFKLCLQVNLPVTLALAG